MTAITRLKRWPETAKRYMIINLDAPLRRGKVDAAKLQ
jgi:hypothetical protein